MKTLLKSDKEELADLRKIAAEHSDCRWWFCIHHNISLETLYGGLTIEARIAEIIRNKPAEEHATRFRNLRPFVGELPTAVAETLAACNKARAARDKACTAYDKAWAACNKAWMAYYKARAAYRGAAAACAEAWAARNKACTAYHEALAAHDAEITDLMNAQWPGNTWNGKNIGWE